MSIPTQLAHCQMCGNQHRIPTDIDAGKFHSTGVCNKCYTGLANDAQHCFGKQYPDGSPLAELSNEDCSQCAEYPACSVWPANKVVWNQLKTIKKENKMPQQTAAKPAGPPPKAKPAPPPPPKKAAPAPPPPPEESPEDLFENTEEQAAEETTEETTEGEAAAEEPAEPEEQPEPAPKAKPAPKAPPKAATAKPAAAKAAAPQAEMVSYGKLQWRKGTSAQLAAQILMAKKQISLKDAAAALEKTGVKSGNYEGRIVVLAAELKKEGLIDKKVENGEIIFVRK